MNEPARDLRNAILELGRQELESSRVRLELVKRLADLYKQAAAAPPKREPQLSRRELGILADVGEARVTAEQIAGLLDPPLEPSDAGVGLGARLRRLPAQARQRGRTAGRGSAVRRQIKGPPHGGVRRGRLGGRHRMRRGLVAAVVRLHP
jgi:hypothetical protein